MKILQRALAGIAGAVFAAGLYAVPVARAQAPVVERPAAPVASGGSAATQEPGTSPLTVVTRAYDVKQLLNTPALSADARRGRALWLQRCAYCHDGVGQPTYRTMGAWLGAETVQLLGPEALRAIIGAGTERMPGFRYTLQPQQVDQLIEFLKTVGPETKPTPAQLARKSSGASAAVGGE